MGVLGAKAWEQVPIPRSENASGGIRPLPRVWPLRRAIVHVTEGGLQGFGLDGSRLSRAADIRRACLKTQLRCGLAKGREPATLRLSIEAPAHKTLCGGGAPDLEKLFQGPPLSVCRGPARQEP